MKFVSLVVQGVKQVGEDCTIVEDDADADFFSIYGRTKQGHAHCVGDFSSREGADVIKTAIESGR